MDPSPQEGVPDRHRDRPHLRRGHQLEQRVLRQDPAEPQQGREHRPRRLRAHRLDGEPAHQPGEVGAAARRGVVPEQGEPAHARWRRPSFDPTRKYSAPWASGVTGIAYNIDRRARRSGRSTTSSRSRARPRSSTRCATPSACSCARSGIETDESELRRGGAGVRQAGGRVRRRQDRRDERQRVRQRPRRTATSRLRSRGPVTSRRSRSTTRTCASRSRTRAACSGPTTS